jgi:hypothetical protein
MNHLKLPGLIAVAAMAMMALLGAGTASATVLCKTATGGLECGGAWKFSGTIKGSLASGTSAVSKNTSGEVIDTCTGGTAEGSASAGGATSTVTGNTSSLSLTGCTTTTKVIKQCEGEIHYVSGTSNGTVTVKGCEVTTNTVLFGSCIYGVGETTDVGIVEEGGSGAAAKVSKVVNKLAGSAFACPSTMVSEASVVRTAPEGTLGVAPS